MNPHPTNNTTASPAIPRLERLALLAQAAEGPIATRPYERQTQA